METVEAKNDIPVWVTVSIIEDEWYREKGEELGIDVKRARLGNVMGAILWDDANAFGWDYKMERYTLELGAAAKEAIMVRQEWEIEAPELPEEVRQIITKLHLVLEGIDFRTIDGYQTGKARWQEVVNGLRAEESKETSEAIDYAFETKSKFNSKWQEFSKGRFSGF